MTNSKYQVDGQQMDEYLKSRFISVSITFSIIAISVLSILIFIFYKQQALQGLWSFAISVPLMIFAFVFGVKRWHDKLRKLSDAEFILTKSSLIQKFPNHTDKEIDFLQIAVVDKKKFGTTIMKGNLITRIDYYRPKKSTSQLDDPNLIFIPSITTNYSELIDTIKQARKHL